VSERASAFRHRFACCDEARRRPTTRASASRYPADHERLSRDAFAIPAVNARVVNGEGAPHRLLQPILRHVHLLPIARLPVCPAHFRSPNPTNGVASAGTPGRPALDGASRASVDSSLTRSAIWRSRASLNPGGLRYRRALEGTPLTPRRCLPRERSARRPLTPPVATSSGLLTRCPPPGPPFPRAPSRALTSCDPRRLPSTSARSTRPPPFRRDERISNASPPPVLGLCRPSTRLPTLFRRLAPWRRWLDRGRYRALFTPGRSWPRAARRLLQSKRSASTTCGPRNPVTPRGLAFRRALHLARPVLIPNGPPSL
jgi:hypothetical protein